MAMWARESPERSLRELLLKHASRGDTDGKQEGSAMATRKQDALSFYERDFLVSV
jgi:hypothetical protein